MKQVRFTKDMHPWRSGDDGVVPDALAEQLLKDKEVDNVRPYPPKDVVFDPRVNSDVKLAKQATPAVQKPQAAAPAAPSTRPVLQPKTYMTRAQRRAQQFGGRRP